MDKKIEEITITIFLENEDSQKFNLWLKDCFHELNEFYTLDAINSHTFYRFQKLEIDKEYTNAVIDPLYNFETTTWKPTTPTSMGKAIIIKWIELGARLELGIRLKVMITFPFDPRILNPLLRILYCLHNDFTDSRAAIFEALQGVKNTFQLDDSILPLPPLDAVQGDAAKSESEVAQDNSEIQTKNKFADMWINRGWVRMKSYNMTQWLQENNAPVWLTNKELQRHIAKTRKANKAGKYYKPKL